VPGSVSSPIFEWARQRVAGSERTAASGVFPIRRSAQVRGASCGTGGTESDSLAQRARCVEGCGRGDGGRAGALGVCAGSASLRGNGGAASRTLGAGSGLASSAGSAVALAGTGTTNFLPRWTAPRWRTRPCSRLAARVKQLRKQASRQTRSNGSGLRLHRTRLR